MFKCSGIVWLQGVKNTLAGEESRVVHLKAQLKELFRFSEDSRHLSDDVLAVVKEHQRYSFLKPIYSKLGKLIRVSINSTSLIDVSTK